MSKILIASFVLMAVAVQAATLHQAIDTPFPWTMYKGPSGTVDLQQKLPMTIAFKRNNMEQMDKIFHEVSDPSHSKYGEHLNNDQMKALVGAKPEAIEAVQQWLALHGIAKVEVGAHHDSCKFTASIAQVAALLKVKFDLYENTVDAKLMARALAAVTIPSHLDSVIEVITGHSGFPKTKAPRVKNAAIGRKVDALLKQQAFLNVTPEVIWNQYKETVPPMTPAGERNIVSFFQAQGQYVRQTDLTEFCEDFLFGRPGFEGHCKVSKYIGPDNMTAPGVESSLDSQYITATSYGLETWVYSYAGDDFCNDMLTWAQDVFAEGNNTFPYVISMSYGSQALPTYCTHKGLNRISEDVKKMGVMGISVIIASGDSGSGEFSRQGWNYGYLGSSFPAEIPWATAVGSTTFADGNSGTETAATFSGGGFTFSFEAPNYQQDAIKQYLDTNTKLPNISMYNASGRGTPDVSALGEQFFVISDSIPQAVGGTSCSTPTFAGMVGRLNSLRLNNKKTLGFLNPLLYKNANAFTDITTGNNDMHADGNGWYAQAGWDPVTGLGTPNFKSLSAVVNAINSRENKKQ